MALPKRMKAEHGGAKDSAAKDGWWGPRDEAKRFARKARRRIDKLVTRGQEGRELR
jgi:hypothetical protein